MVKNTIPLVILSCLLTACHVDKGVIVVRLGKDAQKSITSSLATVQLVNNQFVLNGANLSKITQIKIKEGATETPLEIESISATQIITNTVSNVTFAAGRVFNFILSDASGASTYTVNFSLCDSTLNGKGFNCTITAQDKDVLSFDATTNKWIPRNVNGLAYK